MLQNYMYIKPRTIVILHRGVFLYLREVVWTSAHVVQMACGEEIKRWIIFRPSQFSLKMFAPGAGTQFVLLKYVIIGDRHRSTATFYSPLLRFFKDLTSSYHIGHGYSTGNTGHLKHISRHAYFSHHCFPKFTLGNSTVYIFIRYCT